MGLPLFPFWIDHQYEAQGLLGKGGAGYAVLAKKGTELVAVKLLNLALVRNPEKVIQKFKKEFLTLKKLNHPHIGKISDFGYDTHLRLYYFVGEYIEGKEIAKFCKGLAVKKIEELFVQALQALHYLHTFGRAGLRHNDLKAANLMVTHNERSEAQVKLIDFGLATLAPLEMRGGTASYMAPEQILFTFPELFPNKKMPKPDLRSDLYSLGVVWYFCFTSLNPFLVERDTKATLQRHFEWAPPPPSQFRPEIPKYLDTVLLKLLQRDSASRYSSAAEVIQELRYLSGKPYSVIPATSRRYFLPSEDFIGNDTVLRQLKEKWNQRLSPEPPPPEMVWILGEAGQGKTRLLNHFKNYVQAHDGRFLLLSNSHEAAVEEWSADLKRWSQNLANRLVIAIDDFEPTHPAKKYLEEFLAHVHYSLHWDSATPLPWLFLFTAQEAHPLRYPLSQVTTRLKNFNLEELKEWVRRISPQKETTPPEHFIKQLFQYTHGKPQSAASLLKALGERGLLWNDDGAWQPSLFEEIDIDFAKLPLPKDWHDSFLKEWKKLAPDEQDFLKTLACYATSVPPAWLEKTDRFQSIFDLGWLEWDDKKRVRFKSAFFSKTIYNHLSVKEKQRCHEKIAKILKRLKVPEHLLAFHLAKSAEPKIRLRALAILARFCQAAGRYEEALESYQSELDLLSPNRLSQKLDVAMHIAKLYKTCLRLEEAHAFIDRWLAKIPAAKKFSPWRAAFLRQKGMTSLRQNRIAEARVSLEKALTVLQPIRGHLKEKLILKNTIAKTCLDERKIEAAIALYQETRSALKKLKPSEASEVTNNDLGYALLLKQDGEGAIRILNEDLFSYKQVEDKTHLARCHFLLGSVYRKLKRDFNQAIKHYQHCAALAKNLKDPDWRMRALNGLAATYLDQAELRQALHFFEESLALCRHLKKDLSTLDFETAAILLNVGTCHQEMQNFIKARDIFQTIITVLEQRPNLEERERARLCEATIALADNFLLQHQWEEVQAPMQKAWAIAKGNASLLEHQLAVQILWAEWAQATNRLSELKQHLGLAQEIKTKHHLKPTPLAQRRLEKLAGTI